MLLDELWSVMFYQCYVTVTMFLQQCFVIIISVLCHHSIVTGYMLIREIACNKYPVLLLLLFVLLLLLFKYTHEHVPINLE